MVQDALPRSITDKFALSISPTVVSNRDEKSQPRKPESMTVFRRRRTQVPGHRPPPVRRLKISKTFRWKLIHYRSSSCIEGRSWRP